MRGDRRGASPEAVDPGSRKEEASPVDTSAADPEPAERAAAEPPALDLDEEGSLDEVRRRHLSDSFWNVS